MYDWQRTRARHDALCFFEQAFYRIDDILHCPHRFKFLRLDFLAGFLLQMHDHVNSVNAVQFQIVVQARLGLNVLWVDFKQLNQQRGDFFVNGFCSVITDFPQARCA